jgi:hypothetical protein
MALIIFHQPSATYSPGRHLSTTHLLGRSTNLAWLPAALQPQAQSLPPRRPLPPCRRCNLDRHRPWHLGCRQPGEQQLPDRQRWRALRAMPTGDQGYRPPMDLRSALPFGSVILRSFAAFRRERRVRLSVKAVVGSSRRPAIRRKMARKSCARASKHFAASQRWACWWTACQGGKSFGMGSRAA